MIRLFHKELEAYMVAEGLFDEEVTEDGRSMKEMEKTVVLMYIVWLFF